VSLTGNLTTNMYIDRKSGPGITIRATVYDYDSSSGARTQLGQSSTSFTGSQTGLFTFTVPLTGTLNKAHRLLWTFEAASNNNQSTTLLFQYGGTVRNSVSDATGTSTTLADSNASFCTTPPANLVFSKSVDKPSAAPGDALAYTLTFANTSGATDATGATVVDTLPAGVTFSSATLNGSPVTPTGTNPYTFTVSSSGAAAGTIAAGASGTLVIDATVGNPLDAAIASVTNDATLSSTQTSPIGASATTGITGRGAPGGTPSLAIALAADRTTAAPGDTVTYTVTVVNVGTAGASDVTVSDALPIATYYGFGACSGGCTNAAGTLTWNVGSLAAGASATYTFTMLAGSAGLPAGVTVIPDTASAAATGVGAVTSGTVNVTLDGNPILALAKSASPASGLAPGDTVTYTLVVSNTGSAAASDVVVGDPIPSNASFAGNIAATAGSGAFDAVGNKVVFTVGSLASGASATLTFDATVGTLAAGATTISNTATAVASNAASRSASASVSASAAPVLTLSKSGPAQVAFPAATLSEAASGTTVRVNDAAQLALGELVSIGGTLVTIDAIAGNVLTVSGAVNAPAGTAVVGAITYTLVYGNAGNAAAKAASLTDTLPAGTTFVSATGGGTNAGGVVSWSIASIEAGGTGVMRVTVLPTTGGSLTNQASITCAACNTATANVTTSVGGLVVAKRTTTPTASAGGSAAYVIDVTNTSAAAISGITVTDILSSGFTYASTTSIVNDGTPVAASSSPAAGDATLAWGSFTIQPGKTLTVTYAVDVAFTVGAATYQNEAGATPTGSTVPFDALATTAEDVTVLDAATGIVEGYVFQDADNDGLFDAAVDVPLAGVSLTITDSTATAYTVATDANGYYTRVVATGAASVDVNDADIASGLVRGATFADPASVTVPSGGTVRNDAGYVATSALPDLTLAKSHTGSFAQGQVGASYTIVASNAGTGPTAGTVTVTDTLPAGLTATAIGGTNWTCTLATLSCTRSDALAAGASYDPITVTVDVAGNAAASVTNAASVGGGGEADTTNDAASDPTTIDPLVVPSADVLVTKTNASASVVSGGSTSYTIVVSDAGPDAANGAVVTDPAVAGLAKTAVSCAGESGGAVCPASPTVAQLESGLAIPTLPAGSSVTFTVTANVTAGVGASVTNTATVAVPAGATDPDSTNNQASDTDTVIAPPEPDLAVAKTHVGNFAQGETGATYTLTVSNAGTASTAGTVTLADALPGGLAASAIAGTGWTCTLATLTCTRSDALAAGASYPAVTLTVDVDAAAPASVTNTATVSGGGESNLANDTASDPTTIDAVVVPQADVGVTKTNGASSVTSGASTSYTLVVTNAGPDAADGALLADAAAAGLSKTSVTCGGATGGAACPASPTIAQLEAGIAIPTLPAGSSVTFTVNADVTAAGGTNVSNTVQVAPPGGTTDANAANDSATDTDPVAAAPAVADLVVTKTDGVATVTSGNATTYTIVVGNAGPDAADDATLTDAAADGLAKTAVACGGATGGAACPASPTVAQLEAGIAIPTLPAGSSVTFTVSADVTASAGANVSNIAIVAPPAGTNDPNPGDDQATDTDAVWAAPVPDLAIAKSHVGSFTQGQVGAVYTITVTNVGTGATMGAVTVTDALPAGLTASAAAGAGWTCTVAPVACTRADVLAAGASYPAITLTVDVDAAAAASVTNTASVSSPGDGNAANDTASDPTTIVAIADLAIAKSHAGNFTRGQSGATYSLVVTNVGAGPSAGNVTVADALPAGLVAIAISGTGWTCNLASLACTRSDAIASGASYPTITLTVDVDAAAPASVVNTATVSGGGDANLANNSAIDPTLVDAAPVPQADLAVTKDDGTASVIAGGATSYTIVVANTGPDAAGGATLRDAAVAGLAKTGATCIASSGGAACPAGLSVAALEAGIAIASLPAGSTVTVRVDASVTAAAGVNVTNTAQVLAPAGVNDANAANDAASDTDAVVAPAVANGAISGHVWYDRDGNRRYEGGEVGRPGWRVELWSAGSLVAATMSAADGTYGFTGLAAGSYRVRFSSPNPAAGPMPVNGEGGIPVVGGGTPARCELDNIVLAASGGGVASVAEQSLPIDPSGVVYDSVTRQPIPGATVTLLLGGSPVDPAFVAGGSATVITTPSGGYAFFLLPAAPAGTYSLRVDAAGYRFTSAIIPPSAAPPGFAGGAVTAIAGAPAAGQDTTYYVQFPRPAIDITHDNLAVDPASAGLAPRAVPTLSQWALLLLALAVAALGARRARRR
jgi:uncharacterized repeat protein (TIGR01451 family)